MKLFQKIAAAAEKMSPRKILLLCTLLAVIVFIVIYSVLSSLLGGKEEKKEEVAVNDLVPVIEASVDIKPRTIITDDMIKATAVPQNLVPQGALTDKSAVVGKPTSVAIMAGDMITTRKLNQSGATGFNGLIPKGMRAISFSVNDVTGVAGFAKPGDKVDILLISDKDGENRIASRAILKDVLILAVNKTSMAPQPARQVKKDENGKPIPDTAPKPSGDASSAGTPAVVTVALTPYEAAKLAASQQVGQLQLLLRPYEATMAESDSVSYYVIPMPKAQTPAPSAPAYTPAPQPSAQAPAPAVSISSGNSGGVSGVEVIRGTNVSRGY